MSSIAQPIYGDREEWPLGDRLHMFCVLIYFNCAIYVRKQGPIAMNTQEELRIAFEEYQRGTFVK